MRKSRVIVMAGALGASMLVGSHASSGQDSGTRITGTVISHRGLPSAGVDVLVDEIGAWAPATVTKTDETGRFDLGRVASGEWRIVAIGPDGRTAIERRSISTGDVAATVDVRLPEGHSITGRVLGPHPLQGALIYSMEGPAPGPGAVGRWYRDYVSASRKCGAFARSTSLDAGGAFEFEGLESGVYRLRVLTTHGSAEAKVSTGTRDVALHLVAGGALRGMIRPNQETTKKAIQGSARLTPLSLRRPTVTISIQDGAFAFRPVESGDYELLLDLSSLPDPAPMRVQVEVDKETLLDFAVPVAHLVRGRIVDHANRPVEGVQVALAEPTFHTDAGYWNPQREHVVTDAQGGFKLAGTRGAAQLFVHHPRYVSILVPFDSAEREVSMGDIALTEGKGIPTIQPPTGRINLP